MCFNALKMKAVYGKSVGHELISALQFSRLTAVLGMSKKLQNLHFQSIPI